MLGKWPFTVAARPLTTNIYVISTHCEYNVLTLSVCVLLLPRTLARLLACMAFALPHFILVSERQFWQFVCTSAPRVNAFYGEEFGLLAVSRSELDSGCLSIFGACGLQIYCLGSEWAVLFALYALHTHTRREK